MLVAALNPPENEAYDASLLAWYLETDGGFQFIAVEDVRLTDAKLEAIAVVGEELWLLYEGDKTYFKHYPLEDYVPRF